jgi:hypothetical protein
MALRVLVFAALRVLALYLVIEILMNLVPFLFTIDEMVQRISSFTLVPLVSMAMMIIVAIFLWISAGRLASGITRECNPTIQCQLTLEEAYAIAFVFLGLYSVLSTLGSFLIDLFRFVSAISQYSTGDVVRSNALMDLYRFGITLAAGLAALIGHRAWARKLAKLDSKKSA